MPRFGCVRTCSMQSDVEQRVGVVGDDAEALAEFPRQFGRARGPALQRFEDPHPHRVGERADEVLVDGRLAGAA